MTADPATVHLGIDDATAAERGQAVELEVSEVFTVSGTAFEVVGPCPSSVTLDRR